MLQWRLEVITFIQKLTCGTNLFTFSSFFSFFIYTKAPALLIQEVKQLLMQITEILTTINMQM